MKERNNAFTKKVHLSKSIFIACKGSTVGKLNILSLKNTKDDRMVKWQLSMESIPWPEYGDIDGRSTECDFVVDCPNT